MAKTFPIQIRKITMDHRTGTKQYHLVLITSASADGVEVTLLRWGKTGAWGQVQAERGRAAFIAKLREKQDRGYNVTKENIVDATDEADFKLKIGAGYLAHAKDFYDQIIPGGDTTGMKAAKPIVFEKREDGSFTVKEDDARLIKESEEDKVRQKIGENPSWGSW